MSDIVWSDPEWLQFFPLNKFSALDYFARSSFYDSNCNNEVLRQRGLDISHLPTLPSGVEYVLFDMQEPHLYIICKQNRISPNQTSAVAFYDILDGKIYQMPTLTEVMNARMNRCLYHVKGAFKRIQEDIDPLQKIIKDDGKSEAVSAEASLPDGHVKRNQDEAERGRQVDAILFNTVQSFSKLLPQRQQKNTSSLLEKPSQAPADLPPGEAVGD